MLLVSSMPIVWANDGEFGRGDSFGARLDEDWLAWDKVSGELVWPTVDEVGLFCWPGGLAEPPPLKRALLEQSVSIWGPM
jgi:hypothetical protein